MKTTLAMAKASRIPQALNLCPTDSRFLSWLNEIIPQLLQKKLYIGSYGRFRICATDGCITLPPQIASIERVAVCGQVVPVHDMWFEFLSNGLGPRNASCSTATGCSCGGGCGIAEADLRGWFPTFADVRGTSKKLRLICDVSADVGKRVVVMGYDENRNWIRTAPGGVWQDGETITLSQSPGTDSTKFFDGGITSVQFLDAREGQVWMYERDTVAATSRLIGSYQYFETVPSYARYFFPSIIAQAQTGGGCATTPVEMIGRLEFFPISKDTDVLLIGNLAALKFMAIASKAYENAVTPQDFIRAAQFEKLAEDRLDNEIDFYLGEGREVGVNFKGANIGRVRPVESFL